MRQVAIKRLFKQDLDPETLADFKKEVEIMARLRHPNTLLFMGACTVPGNMAVGALCVCVLCDGKVADGKRSDGDSVWRQRRGSHEAQGTCTHTTSVFLSSFRFHSRA